MAQVVMEKPSLAGELGFLPEDGSREAEGCARDTAGWRRSRGRSADGNTRKPAVLGIARFVRAGGLERGR